MPDDLGRTSAQMLASISTGSKEGRELVLFLAEVLKADQIRMAKWQAALNGAKASAPQ